MKVSRMKSLHEAIRPRRETRPAPSRILLLCLLPIGDTLFTTPTIRAIRAHFPHAHITALVHTQTRPLLHWVPEIDEIVVLPTGSDWHGIRTFARFLRYMREQRFDASIDFTSPAYKWLNFVARIPLRTYMKFDRLWWIIPTPHRHWRTTHATRHYYDSASELDLPPWHDVSHSPQFRLPESQRRAARLFLLRRGVHDISTERKLAARPLVAVHAGGAGLNGLKRWPADRFAALCRALTDRWGAQIVLLGGSEDEELVEDIAAQLAAPPVVAAGKISLLTSAAVIEACDLFIGNDSGPLHFAAAVGTPHVAIFGPTCLANFVPIPAHGGYGHVVLPRVPCPEPQYFVGGQTIPQRRACQGVCRALATIPVDAVLAAAEDLLAKRFRPVRVAGDLDVVLDRAMPGGVGEMRETEGVSAGGE